MRISAGLISNTIHQLVSKKSKKRHPQLNQPFEEEFDTAGNKNREVSSGSSATQHDGIIFNLGI